MREREREGEDERDSCYYYNHSCCVSCVCFVYTIDPGQPPDEREGARDGEDRNGGLKGETVR